MPSDKPMLYTLDDLDTRDHKKVAQEIVKLFGSSFPGEDSSFISWAIGQTRDMFLGKYRHYQAMDTKYHDLEHTLQATLCWVRMMTNRHRLGAEPVLTARDFRVGFMAILNHDIGYLKEEDDDEGTGAKYTFVHERRSCELVAMLLEKEDGWTQEDIDSIQRFISCTGPNANIDAIPFADHKEKVLGESVRTADYLGQMSDPRYVIKLPVLYQEFEESDRFRGIPKEKRLFKNVHELLSNTPDFWENVVKKTLDETCHGLYKYLSIPYPGGRNPYYEKVEENINIVRQMMAS